MRHRNEMEIRATERHRQEQQMVLQEEVTAAANATRAPRMI